MSAIISDFTWLASSQRRYQYALGALPPKGRQSRSRVEMFLLGEAHDHDHEGRPRYSVHRRESGHDGPDRYEVGSRPITEGEFAVLLE